MEDEDGALAGGLRRSMLAQPRHDLFLGVKVLGILSGDRQQNCQVTDSGHHFERRQTTELSGN